ncbi:MAG: hypothetical protein XXXJIFNMEKO3_01406 [Candidatus Erwinia impunctatus]|nr:hypothetical protein XXXJIFNMEKO_01406 [Culicoides impunctatus]
MRRRVLLAILICITPGLLAFKPVNQNSVESDDKALELLYNTISYKVKNTPGYRLETIGDDFPLYDYTDFTMHTHTSEEVVKKPSSEISDDEWQAFINTSINYYSENGSVDYKLVDLDGDGKRDLILNAYTGGTSLSSTTGVLKRTGDRFVALNHYDNESISGEFFLQIERGANEGGQWIRIKDQVYALWFSGMYGEDNFYLLRPFNTENKIPNITVNYKYQYDDLSIQPESEEGELKPALNTDDKKRLIEVLNTESFYYHKQSQQQENMTICPVPVGTSSEDAENYSAHIAGNYITQPVATLPVWINGACFVGSLESLFGRGEFLLISSPKEMEILGAYSISGVRHIESITKGWKFREGNISF